MNKVREIGDTNYKISKREWNEVKSLVFKKDYLKLLKDLSKDDSIIVVKPDKGKCIVTMDKVDYLAKMETILDDKTEFQRITGDISSIIIR